MSGDLKGAQPSSREQRMLEQLNLLKHLGSARVVCITSMSSHDSDINHLLTRIRMRATYDHLLSTPLDEETLQFVRSLGIDACTARIHFKTPDQAAGAGIPHACPMKVDKSYATCMAGPETLRHSKNPSIWGIPPDYLLSTDIDPANLALVTHPSGTCCYTVGIHAAGIMYCLKGG